MTFSVCIDMTGQKFGRLTVIEREGTDKHGGARWKCSCKCGKETVIIRSCLITGKTQSCGCLNSELASKRTLGKRNVNFIHGMGRTREYSTWHAMLSRCRYEKNKDYKRYGGRGIQVCERWGSFLNFLEDMGPKPKNRSLDRVDNDGNYEPGNCRWATKEEQSNNRETCVMVSFGGENKSLSRWCRAKGLTTN